MTNAIVFPTAAEVEIDWKTTYNLTGVHDKVVYLDVRGQRWLGKVAKYFRSKNKSGWGNDTACELAALRLQQLLGAPTPAFTLAVMPFQTAAGGVVARKRVLLTEWIEGAKTIGRYWDIEMPLTTHRSEALSMLLNMAVDYLSGDTDRHAENFIYKDGTVYGIDHGFAFNNEAYNTTDAVGRFLKGLSTYRSWLQGDPDAILKLLRPKDLSDLFNRVNTMVRPQFNRITSRRRDKDALDRLNFFEGEFRVLFSDLIESYADTTKLSPAWKTWARMGGAA